MKGKNSKRIDTKDRIYARERSERIHDRELHEHENTILSDPGRCEITILLNFLYFENLRIS